MRFDFAHNALRYLIRQYKIKEMNIPYYLCDVVRHTLFEEKCRPKFYHIDDNFIPVKQFNKQEFILYPNYFGVCDKITENLANIYPNLIVDNAHAYYSPPLGFACFNSSYKFKEGNFAYLWIRGADIEKPQTHFKEERKREFLRLDKLYGKTNLLKLDKNSNPFCYPYLVETTEEADRLVEHFKSEGNTIYRYWNAIPETYNEYKFYSRLIPIPLM